MLFVWSLFAQILLGGSGVAPKKTDDLSTSVLMKNADKMKNELGFFKDKMQPKTGNCSQALLPKTVQLHQSLLYAGKPNERSPIVIFVVDF